MFFRCGALGSCLVVLAGALPAQSLTLSRAAAAPTRDDSIYALRVDSAAYPGHDEVFLLDDATVRVEADGRHSTTVHRVVQILTTAGVDDWGQMTFWYTSGRERVIINRILVVGPDGSILHSGPAHQEEVNPPADQDAPVLSDRRGIQVTLAGVAPGTLVDYSYTLETIRPTVPGDFSFLWYVNGEPPILRSRFTFDTPAELQPRVRSRNISGAPSDTVVAGRRVRRWLLADLPAVKRQIYGGTPNGVYGWIWVSGNVTWRDVGLWYDSLSRGRYQLTDSILVAYRGELKRAASLGDSLRAAYRWVAQDFRYVSMSLGDGSYQPRTPREVFESRFGDCKDKTTLFVSLARRLGLTAYPVLVSSDGDVDSLQPTLTQFDHVIPAVVYGGATHYFDVTSALLPYGDVPSDLQGSVGLALPASGPKVVVIPASPADSNWHDYQVVGAFTPDGGFTGRLTITATGTEQGDLRDELAGLGQKEPADRAEQLRKQVTQLYATAVVDSERYNDGNDLAAPATLTVWFTATRVVGQVEGAKYYFNLPFGRFSNPENLSRLNDEGQRRFPIDVAQVNSPSIYRTVMEVALPAGWRAELPRDVSVQGPFGYYRARYSQTGRTLRVAREMGGGRGLLPPDSAPALRTWLTAVDADRAKMIVLNRGTGVDLVATGSTPASSAGGTLPGVVLGTADVSTDARMMQEGPNTGSQDFLTTASTKPVESYHRAFSARQVVFPAGSSHLVSLQAFASAYHTAPEARWTLEALAMFDLRRLLGAYLGQRGTQQMTVDSARAVPLQGIGDHAEGWMFRLVSPLTTLDLGMALATRGRVAEAVVVVGPQGVQDSDVASLLRVMDGRLQQQGAYLHDVADDGPDTAGVAAADSALAVATPLALNAIAAGRPDAARQTVRRASFSKVNGWPQYALTIQGKGFTFPVGRADAMEVAITVTRHDTPAQALQAVVAAQRASRLQAVQEALGNVAGFGNLPQAATESDSTAVEDVTLPRLGSWSAGTHTRLRGLLRADVDAVVFARGKLSMRVNVTRPDGGSDMAGTAAVAGDVLARARTLDPGSDEKPPAPALLAAVTKVVDAERAVDSLVRAKDIDGAFRTVDAAGLDHAPVGFNASTWNSLCWEASLAGQAKRARPACEAAVAPDTTDLAIRDSRGLERALSGDLAGARDDFEYIVANVGAGTFRDLRSEWLSALRAGQNPFTPAVIEQLRQ